MRRAKVAAPADTQRIVAAAYVLALQDIRTAAKITGTLHAVVKTALPSQP